LAGRSKFNYWRLWNFAIEGITGFSTAPLRVATYLGLATALLAFGYGPVDHRQDPALGRSGAGLADHDGGDPVPRRRAADGARHHRRYLGRLYIEAKQRPLYLVDSWNPGAAESA
jgi:hypothetical protein